MPQISSDYCGHPRRNCWNCMMTFWLLIVFMGFCDSCHHPINVAVVDNNLKTQLGTIVITWSDCFDVCRAIFTLIKNTAGEFVRPQKGSTSIWHCLSFDEIFSGGKNTCMLFIWRYTWKPDLRTVKIMPPWGLCVWCTLF